MVRTGRLVDLIASAACRARWRTAKIRQPLHAYGHHVADADRAPRRAVPLRADVWRGKGNPAGFTVFRRVAAELPTELLACMGCNEGLLARHASSVPCHAPILPFATEQTLGRRWCFQCHLARTCSTVQRRCAGDPAPSPQGSPGRTAGVRTPNWPASRRHSRRARSHRSPPTARRGR